jgi:hypothetical protein
MTGPLTKLPAVRPRIIIRYILFNNAQDKTDRIDLAAFYPVFACLIDHSHAHRSKPQNPAIFHKILNAPNPNARVAVFPDGSEAKLVVLGDPISPREVGSEAWWPKALTPNVRGKLTRRFVREGYVLPIITAVCLSLLTEMYSAAPNGDQRHARLRYRSSPIKDFGIAKGSAQVTNQDRLGYIHLSEGRIFKGQDPDDHYWIYFTTLKGEDVVLDCGMFTFNMCISIQEAPYLPTPGGVPPNIVPAFFGDRVITRNAPALQHERERFSVLRNKDLQTAVENLNENKVSDVQNIYSFMENVAGRSCTQEEKSLLIDLFYNHCEELAPVLAERKWKLYPETPPMAIEQDPGEVIASDKEDDSKWFKEMKKWNRKYNKGKISKETLGAHVRDIKTQM